MKTNPLTGRPYSVKYFDPETVETLLLLVGVEQCDASTWTKEQLHQAGDWALRAHLSASDNTNRVPTKPSFVPEILGINPDATSVMDIFGPRGVA